jgi:hypothetical protein
LTTSAAKGAPEMERRLIPADKVLVEAVLPFAPTWPKDAETQKRRTEHTITQAVFMNSPGRMATLYSEFFCSRKNKI